MKKDLQQIISVLHSIIPFIKSEYSVLDLEIFGSYITNKQKKRSDLDLLVTFSKAPSLLKFMKLENYISDKIGIKVDLVMKDSLKSRLKSSIINNSVPV
jgi:predicted nucleotidyltransferase